MNNDKLQRVRPWSGRSEVQISGRSNRTQRCQRLAPAATFLQKKLCCLGAMTRRWAPQTRHTPGPQLGGQKGAAPP